MAVQLLVLVGGSSGHAFAQATGADCEQDPACRELKDRAAERSRAGNLIDALRLYKLAYEVQPDPRLLYNIARVLQKQGQAENLTEATMFYQRFLDSDVSEEEPRQKALEYLAQIQSAAVHQPSTAPRAASSSVLPALPAKTPSADASSARVDAKARKPVYKRWWIWTLAGSVTVVTVTGLAVGLALGPQGPAAFSGIRISAQH